MMDMMPKTPITVYNKVGDTFKRTVIQDCIWKQSTKVSFRSQGRLPIDSVKIYVKDYSNYSQDNEAYGWTVKVGDEKKITYIVKGECYYEFDSIDENSLSKQTKEFKSKFDYKTVKSYTENFYGSGRISHLLIIC